MVDLNRTQLRLLFMREGVVAAAAWQWLTDDAPTLVKTHLLTLTEAVMPSYAMLPEEERDMLISTFFAAARKARTPDGGNKSRYEEFERYALEERILATSEGNKEAPWERVPTEAESVVSALSATQDLISEASITILYEELARQIAPLWITGEIEDIPALLTASFADLAPVSSARVRLDRQFNDRTSEFFTPSFADAEVRWIDASVDMLTRARYRYLTLHPLPGPLPREPQARAAEQERRATIREDLKQRVGAAVHGILSPILRSNAQHLSSPAYEPIRRDYTQRRRLRAMPAPSVSDGTAPVTEVARARTDTGRQVMLRSDGTWIDVLTSETSVPVLGGFRGMPWGASRQGGFQGSSLHLR